MYLYFYMYIYTHTHVCIDKRSLCVSVLVYVYMCVCTKSVAAPGLNHGLLSCESSVNLSLSQSQEAPSRRI